MLQQSPDVSTGWGGPKVNKFEQGDRVGGGRGGGGPEVPCSGNMGIPQWTDMTENITFVGGL